MLEHILRRMGFGASPEDLSYYADLTPAALVDHLLNFEQVQEDVDAQIGGAGFVGITTRGAGFSPDTVINDARQRWLFRMIHTRRPLQEKMALFWHNHFATAYSKVAGAVGTVHGAKMMDAKPGNFANAFRGQVHLFREMALANFRDLLVAVAKDPAMLVWLDGRTNTRQRPQENFGRELMELFTTGIGHYTEKDVDEVARTFTGWQFLRDRTTGATTFYRNDNEHDNNTKTVLGRTGNLDGTDVIDMLIPHPATARRVASELFKYFVHDNPTPAQIEPLAKIYLDSKYEIRPVVRAIIKGADFFSEEAYLAKVKSPVEFVLGTLKQVSPRATNLSGLPDELARMGQELFNPPTVFGWDGGIEWINSTTMLARMNYANILSQGRGSSGIDTAAILSQNPTAEGIVDFLAGALGPLPYSAGVRADLVGYLNQMTGNSSADSKDTKVRGLIHLMLGSAEYQLA
jgi:uncharacterized protein (DUF1800 family)